MFVCVSWLVCVTWHHGVDTKPPLYRKNRTRASIPVSLFFPCEVIKFKNSTSNNNEKQNDLQTENVSADNAIPLDETVPDMFKLLKVVFVLKSLVFVGCSHD